jgi:hypothetical protein
MSNKPEIDLSNVKVPAPSSACATRPQMDVFDVINGGSGGVIGAMAAIAASQKLGLIGGEEPSALKYAGAVLLTAGGIVAGSTAAAWTARKISGFFGKDCQ